MAEPNTIAAAPMQAEGWMYLSGSGEEVQQHGPYPVETMKELFKHGYITEHALVWTAGQDSWQPLSSCQDLYEQLVFTEEERRQRGPKKKKQKKTDDAELAEFEAQIAALEEGQEEEQGTPPPEEQSFVDDDGTEFVWDSSVRKFRPKDLHIPAAGGSGTQAAASDAQQAQTADDYTREMMTFGGIDDTHVTLEDALAEEQASLEHAELLTEAAMEEGGASAIDAGAPAATAPKQDVPMEAAAAATQQRDRIAKPLATAGAAAGSSVPQAEGGAGRPGATATPPPQPPQQGSVAVQAGEENQGATRKDNGKSNVNRNTSVYVIGIPDDATEDEVAEEFSRCGIIKQDADGNPRVKLYRDKETGMMKGDALITFLQRPSVSLAQTLMHGRSLRPNCGAAMIVQEAMFEAKPDGAAAKGAPSGGAGTAPASGGGGDRKGGAVSGGGSAGAKGKGKKAGNQQDKALGWGGFDDTHKASEVTVVLTNLFTIDDMTLSPDLEHLLADYIVGRCRDLGAVERVRVFRKSPGGVATARFRVPEDAQTAIQRFSATALIWGMVAPQEAQQRRAERVAEVEEDVLERSAALGVRVVGEGGMGVLLGESGHGMVAVGCSDIAGMQRLVMGFDGAAYDGRALKSDAVEAFLWDGETPPSTYGAPVVAAATDEARLEAYAAELEGRAVIT